MIPVRSPQNRAIVFFFAWFASTLALPVAGGCQEKKPVYVLSVSGIWELPDSGRRKLARYETLHLGERVDCKGQSQGSAKLELLLATTPYAMDCKPAQRIAPPPAHEERPASATSAFARAIQSLLSGTQALPVPAAVRSLGSPSDSVICIGQDGSIDVAPSIGALKARRYRLRFNPLVASSGQSSEFEVEWTGQAPVPATKGVPAAGLYRLDVVTADDAESTMGTWAAVRVAPQSNCKTDMQALTEAREIVAKADPPLSESGTRALYFLVLSSLNGK